MKNRVLGICALMVFCATADAERKSGIDKKGFDRLVRVQDDLFMHVNGEWFEGTGHRVEDDATERRAYATLRAKYGWQMRLLDFVSTLTGRINARAVLELKI